MTDCKIVRFDVKDGIIKAATNIENHFVNESPVNRGAITDYFDKNYQAKRIVPMVSRPFFPVKTTTPSFTSEATLYLEEA